VADIGGSNARFAVSDLESGELRVICRYPVSEIPEFDQALEQFLGEVIHAGHWCPLPTATCIGVACPIDGEVLQITNSPWRIYRKRLETRLQQTRIEIINDFAAVGHAITALAPGDWHPVGGRDAIVDSPIAVLGPGTGLGVGCIVPVGSGYQVIEGEGGHADFAPIDAEEIAIFNILARRYGRVSIERLLSGSGIVNIYQAQAQLRNEPASYKSPEEITAAAVNDSSALAKRSLSMFCEILGSVAGNLALTFGARGGVYIAGGITPRILGFLENSQFRQRFEAKGRFRSYLENIPVRVVVKQDLGLHGAARKTRY
jgi:glucokinase